MKKVNEFIYNPALTMGIGLMPILLICVTLKASLFFGIVYAILLIISNLLFLAFKEIIVESVRIPCYALILFGVVYFIDSLINEFMPLVYLKIPAIMTYIFATTTSFYMFELAKTKTSSKVGFLSCVLVAIEYLVSMIVIGAIREFLSCGQLYGVSLFQKFNGFSFFASLSGGLTVCVFVIFIYNFFVYKLIKLRLIDTALIERYEEKQKLIEIAKQSKVEIEK